MSKIDKFFVKVRKRLAVAVLCVAAFNTAHAQWMTQRIDLKKGWNAVHLKVHPADRSCANVFPAAVTKVSWWNRDRIDDGTGSAITDFCSWYRGEPSTFSNVIGDHCYLVYSTAPQQVDVIGRPALPRGTIYRGEANLVGLNVPVNAGEDAPSYLDYFKDCKPLWNSNKPWSAVGTDGEPQAVVNVSEEVPIQGVFTSRAKLFTSVLIPKISTPLFPVTAPIEPDTGLSRIFMLFVVMPFVLCKVVSPPVKPFSLMVQPPISP